jgi:hypothetical protein
MAVARAKPKPKAKAKPRPIQKARSVMAEKEPEEVKQEAPKAKKESGTKVKLLKEYWASPEAIDPATGFAVEDKRPAGEMITLPREEAKRLIDAGAAERTDPLPDE